MTPLIHNIPGRMRVKLAGLKHNNRAGLEIRSRLTDQEYIHEVSTNTATGSVLIYYDADKLQAKEIFTFFKNNGYFNDSEPAVDQTRCKLPGSPANIKIGEVVIGFALERILAVALRPLGCH